MCEFLNNEKKNIYPGRWSDFIHLKSSLSTSCLPDFKPAGTFQPRSEFREELQVVFLSGGTFSEILSENYKIIHADPIQA